VEFADVAGLDQLPLRRGMSVSVKGRPVALFRVGDNVHAIDDSCPHAGASLAPGRLDGCFVQCPAHGLRFDLRTGCMPGNPEFGTAIHVVRIEQGRVLVGSD
jgi:3-phenylpropionate/trans-cinnamate dioxygenase ferredoxin subunit